MPDNNEIRDGLTNITDQQIEGVLISNAQHAKTARILKGLIALMFLLIVSFAFLYFSEQKPTLRTVWFDRQREHSNEGFQRVDDKYPAAFEVWEGTKLIERWHWKIDSQVKTHQFDDYILRCVALYDEADEYVGFTQTIMDHYPSEKAGSAGYYKNNPKENSIKFTLNLKENYIRFENDNFGFLIKKGKLKHTFEVSSNFKHNYSTTNEVHQIVEDYLHYAYICHLSDMFPFLNKKIIEPFDANNGTGYSYLYEQYKTHRMADLSTEAKLARALYDNDVSQSKLNAALAYIHDDLFYWNKVNIDHLGESWEKDIVERLEFKPVLKHHLFQRTEGPIGKNN